MKDDLDTELCLVAWTFMGLEGVAIVTEINVGFEIPNLGGGL